MIQLETIQDSRKYKLQKEELKNCQTWPIKEKPQPIELQSAEFYLKPNSLQNF